MLGLEHPQSWVCLWAPQSPVRVYRIRLAEWRDLHWSLSHAFKPIPCFQACRNWWNSPEWSQCARGRLKSSGRKSSHVHCGVYVYMSLSSKLWVAGEVWGASWVTAHPKGRRNLLIRLSREEAFVVRGAWWVWLGQCGPFLIVFCSLAT